MILIGPVAKRKAAASAPAGTGDCWRGKQVLKLKEDLHRHLNRPISIG
jgi:hypothetical protein